MTMLLPFWLIAAPAVLLLVDSIVSPKTSSMGSRGATAHPVSGRAVPT